MTKNILYILISLSIFSCSSTKKNKTYSEKELESSILSGDFIFVGDTITKKKIVKENGPKFNPNINKDSLFQIVIKKAHPSKINELTEAYNEGNIQTKEFLLMMLSMNKSSKKEQIRNLKDNENNIKKLIQKYSELVPDSLVVSIEYNPKDIILSTDKSIDLRIHSNRKSKNGGIDLNFQEWNLDYDSEVLLKQIKNLGWNKQTLIEIKNLLDSANCSSIENGKVSTVGFKRSGMGKYSYKFFEKDLNEKEQTEYNDGCYYIYYERNIVLEFGGGAVGQQCFETE